MDSTTSASTSLVSAVPAAPASEAVTHFSHLLAYETDCWDVHETMASDNADFVLLDVRGEGAFRAGHVTGAVHLPHAQLSLSLIHI